MEYCIVENDMIINVIISDEDFAEKIGAVPSYDGARIGDKYNPPYKPIPHTNADALEAQVTYTAMMTDTLIGG